MTRSARIMVVNQGRGVWGAQRYLLRLAPLLAHRGFDLVLAGPPQLELADAWTSAGLERVDLDVPVVVWMDCAERRRLAELLTEHNFKMKPAIDARKAILYQKRGPRFPNEARSFWKE